MQLGGVSLHIGICLYLNIFNIHIHVHKSLNVSSRLSYYFYRISTERHRAEIRRAVNDELLGSVAEW